MKYIIQQTEEEQILQHVVLAETITRRAIQCLKRI